MVEIGVLEVLQEPDRGQLPNVVVTDDMHRLDQVEDGTELLGRSTNAEIDEMADEGRGEQVVERLRLVSDVLEVLPPPAGRSEAGTGFHEEVCYLVAPDPFHERQATPRGGRRRGQSRSTWTCLHPRRRA